MEAQTRLQQKWKMGKVFQNMTAGDFTLNEYENLQQALLPFKQPEK